MQYSTDRKLLTYLRKLISQTTQYLDSWLSADLFQSEIKMKLLEV